MSTHAPTPIVARPLRWDSFEAARDYAAQHVRGYPDWRVEQPVGRSYWQIALIPSATTPRYATRLDIGPANPAGIVVGDWVLSGYDEDADYGQVHTVDLDRRVAIVGLLHLGGYFEVPLHPNDPDWTADVDIHPVEDHDIIRRLYEGRCP